MWIQAQLPVIAIPISLAVVVFNTHEGSSSATQPQWLGIFLFLCLLNNNFWVSVVLISYVSWLIVVKKILFALIFLCIC